MAKKKQQSIDSHLKFAGGGGTVSKNDVIELSGTEDDTAMDTDAVQPRVKTSTTRRAGARNTTREENERSRREEEENLERAMEESRREKEREDRRKCLWEENMCMEVQGNSSKGSGKPASPVTLQGEVPIQSAPHPISVLPSLPVPRPPLLQQPLVVAPRPPLLQQSGVVPRPPLLQQPIVTLERVVVPSNCSPLRPHPSPRTVLWCDQSDASKGASPMSEGQREEGVATVDEKGKVSSGEHSAERSNSTNRGAKQKMLSLRRQDRGKKEVGSGGASEGDRREEGSLASPSKRGVRKEEKEEKGEKGTGGAMSSGGKPRARTPVLGGNSELSSAILSKPGGGSPVQTQIDTATPPPVDSKPSPPQLWAPPGTSTCQYTSVILRVFDDYIKQLEAAQSRQLVRVPWGPPVTPKTGVGRETSRSGVNKKVWSLPYREQSDTSDTSDEEMAEPTKPPVKPTKPPGEPTKPPVKPTKPLIGSKVDQVVSKDERPVSPSSDVFNFCHSSDDELNIQTTVKGSTITTPTKGTTITPTKGSTITITPTKGSTITTITPTKGSTITTTPAKGSIITTITPTKGSTITTITPTKGSRAAAGKSSCAGTKQGSPADKDITPPLSGGGPFEFKGKVSPPLAEVSTPISTRSVTATPSNSAWLSKRGATTPAGGSASGSREKRFGLGKRRKSEQTASSFDELVEDMAKRHKTSSQLPAKPKAPHRTLWASREKQVKEEEEEERGSLESESSEEAVPTRNGKGVIDLTEDSQADPSRAMRACPLCQKRFAQAKIEDHASTCQVDDIGSGSSPPPPPKVRTSLLGPPEGARNVLESGECSGRELEFLSGSPNEEEEATPSPKMAPQLYPLPEGGYMVDMNTVSDSPVKVFRKTHEQPNNKLDGARNVLESDECSGRELELLSGSPNEEEEATPSPKMAPQLYPLPEGGYMVDMNTVSDSPVKAFRKIHEQPNNELYYKPFVSSGASESTGGQGGQRSQPHKRGWKGRGGRYRGGGKKRLASSRGRGKKGAKLTLT